MVPPVEEAARPVAVPVEIVKPTTDIVAEELLPRPVSDFIEYSVDAMQRSVLFWDVMRKRGNQTINHFLAGQPPVLEFEYETIMDGRTLDRPANYSLLRIIPDAEFPVDPKKRPFVIVDPRAGHGPGIGGSKKDSQVGVAMRAGHPVYFLTFSQVPVPGQTLRDVRDAEAVFIKTVAERHPEADGKPCVLGNCQGGWAIVLLSASHPDVTGPLILSGSPLSYWAGKSGKNPMRYLGGLLGGTWMASLASDMGAGLFDGAYLVQNFENLNPANTLWTKQYNVYSKVDTEEERFLHFEKWWNGFFLTNTEEMDFIVNELFVGNRLQQGKIDMGDGPPLDIKDIKSPIVIFCSEGDNITPPEQALAWVVDVYGNTDEIKIHGQTIVYHVHPSVGHLGIFVSGKIASREHKGILHTLDMIEMLPPGLYELEIEDPDIARMPAEGAPDEFEVRFKERTIEDLRAIVGDQEDKEEQADFAAVSAVSDYNEWLYKTFARPFVRATATEQSALANRLMNPARAQHLFMSDLNPAMLWVRAMAPYVREHRSPVKPDNSFLKAQQSVSDSIVKSLDTYRDARDSASEDVFNVVYGKNGLGGFFKPLDVVPKRDEAQQALLEMEARDVLSRAKEGGFAAAILRIGAAMIHLVDQTADRRGFLALVEEAQRHPKVPEMSLEQAREIMRLQSYIVQIDVDLAQETLKDLLPTEQDRRDCMEFLQRIGEKSGRATPERKEALAHIAASLGVGEPPTATA